MHIIRMIPSLIQTGVFCLCLGLGLLICLPFLLRKRGEDPFDNYYDGKRKNK